MNSPFPFKFYRTRNCLYSKDMRFIVMRIGKKRWIARDCSFIEHTGGRKTGIGTFKNTMLQINYFFMRSSRVGKSRAVLGYTDYTKENQNDPRR